MIPQKQDIPGVTEALSAGNLRLANQLIGSAWQFKGRVVHGNHLGRTLGFPTANLESDNGLPVALANGVYAVTVSFGDKKHHGMANIGMRPTISGMNRTLEINLFDFEGDLYGQVMTVSFVHRIRDERKFENLEQLVGQIRLDKEEAIRILSLPDHPDTGPENILRP